MIKVREKLLVPQLIKKIPRVIWNPKVEVQCRVRHFVPILSLHPGQYRRILGPYTVKLFSACGSLLRLHHESNEGYSTVTRLFVESSWNVMAHGDAREGKWRGNWRMKWVATTLHTTSEHGVSSNTSADAHTFAASSPLNWRPRRFKWTRPFRRKTKSGFCACAITFQTQSTRLNEHLFPSSSNGAWLIAFYTCVS